MRKKLAATVCVFAGVIISASLLIVSVLAATSASATITASVSYTPAIQAKVWLNDGTNNMLIFDNTNTPGELYTGVTISGGTINMPSSYKAVNGTTFTITVENQSTGTTDNVIWLGLFVGGKSTAKLDNTVNPATELENEKFVDVSYYIEDKTLPQENWTPVYKTLTHNDVTYTYIENSSIAQGSSGSITFTPEIVVPGTLNFDILLFDTP